MKFFSKIFKALLLPIYKLWILTSLKIKRASFFYDSFSVFITNRRLLHVSWIAIGVGVIATNILQAKEIQGDYGKESLLANVVTGYENEIIVESGLPTQKKQFRYLADQGILFSERTSSKENTRSATNSLGGLVQDPTAINENNTRTDIVTYTVEESDTVSTIAERFGISTSTILWANSLGANDFIRPGQSLKIPPTSGVVYTVQSGDTLDGIAKKYSADVEKILDFNKLVDASEIAQGQTLILPEGKVPPPPAPVSRLATFTDVFRGTPAPSSTETGNYIWPTTARRITTYFSWRHTGIDIDGGFGDPIYASRAGRIVEAGWHGGYGLTVQVDHGGGVRTLYGHFQKIYVSVGQNVSQGQALGEMGSTGYSTGSHLHFEIRINGTAYNPFSYL